MNIPILRREKQRHRPVMKCLQSHPASWQKRPRRKSSEFYSRTLSSSAPCFSHQPCSSSSGHRALSAACWLEEAAWKHCCGRAYAAVLLALTNKVSIILKSLPSFNTHFNTLGFVKTSDEQNMLAYTLIPFFSAPVITWWTSVYSVLMK